MDRTMTQGKPLHPYPLGWVAAIVVAAMLAIAVSSLPRDMPAPAAPSGSLMLDENFAP